MNILKAAVENLLHTYSNQSMPSSVILSVLAMVALLSAYEFVVYRLVSHRELYNRSFQLCVTALPFFIATIILSLQSNLVITLGTIGALAILRFRTAVKDPLDMLYLLWAVHIGITCGCQLYEMAVLTSLAVTVYLLVAGQLHLGRSPYLVVFHCETGKEPPLLELIKGQARSAVVKSRNYTAHGIDVVMECSLNNPAALADALKAHDEDLQFSVLRYDGDDILS